MGIENALLLESAIGWRGPIRLSVTNRTSKRERKYVMQRPYALIGHSTKCDITLKKQEVEYRHAYLQVVGGRLLCVDLTGGTGTHWEDGPKKAGWITADQPVRIDDYVIQLVPDETSSPDPSALVPLEFKPLNIYSEELGFFPPYDVQFLNAQIKELTVPLLHLITLVGRDSRCKFHFDDENVSNVHCCLLRTQGGVWVIDLLGRGGTNVNGNRAACVRMEDGDTLKVGRYRMRVQQRLASMDSVLDEDLTSTESDLHSMSSVLISANKVFVVERVSETLVLTPKGDSHRFYYADVHQEANRVRELLENPELKNLIIDLGNEELFGSTTIGVFSRLRNVIVERGGQAAICNASQRMRETLQEMNLSHMWRHFESRAEALERLIS